jgi:hypothetical protein
MTERKYSVSEIDKMRQAVDVLLTRNGVPFRKADRVVEIEQRLRTYMMNGTDPKELEEKAQAHIRREYVQRSPDQN